MYEVAAQFRVYLVPELRGVLVVVFVKPQVFITLLRLSCGQVNGRECKAARALRVLVWDASKALHAINVAIHLKSPYFWRLCRKN